MEHGIERGGRGGAVRPRRRGFMPVAGRQRLLVPSPAGGAAFFFSSARAISRGYSRLAHHPPSVFLTAAWASLGSQRLPGLMKVSIILPPKLALMRPMGNFQRLVQVAGEVIGDVRRTAPIALRTGSGDHWALKADPAGVSLRSLGHAKLADERKVGGGDFLFRVVRPDRPATPCWIGRSRARPRQRGCRGR